MRKTPLGKDDRPFRPESIRDRRRSVAVVDVSAVFDLGRSDGADIARTKDVQVGRSVAAIFPRKRPGGRSTR